jgi:hypothetical protein
VVWASLAEETEGTAAFEDGSGGGEGDEGWPGEGGIHLHARRRR